MSFEITPLIVLVYFYCTLHIHLAPSFAFPEFSPGEVSPERLEIGIGSSASIKCRMNLTMFDGSDSSSLYFSESDTKKRVPQDDIKIINETTIVYTLRNAMEQDRRYVCLSAEKGIAEAHVIVGTPPTEVKEFKCRGFNYRYMVCNFTIPHNTLDVKYDLRYYWTSPQYKQICELEKIASGKYAICNITKDNGQYHQHYEYYNFTLKGYNSLGSKSQSFGINNFESVIPARPDVYLERKTNNSASFRWIMDPLFNTKGFKYEIRLRPHKFNWTDYVDYRVKGNKSSYILDLHNLPYAYYKYTLSIRIRVRSTNSDEDLWSEPVLIDFETSACLPDAPPKTDVSSFDLIDTTESRVRLYWEQRPFYRENGPNFQYIVKEVRIDDISVEMSPLHIDRTSAVFPWDRKHKYEFIIASYNDEGYSKHSSRIRIPAMGLKRLVEYTPDWIRSVYRESNRTFTLSWNPPPNESNLVDYTVFWCYSKPALSNECNDTIQFTHLSKSITQYTTDPQQKEHSVIFAVSANYRNFTTGLHWTMCTADISIDLIKMDPEFKVISSHEISVQWNLVHVCTSILEGYNLTICAVKDMNSENCLHRKTTFNIEKNAKSYLITDLEPYTAYKIQMYMYSKLKRGKDSDAQILMTEEEAPSPPRDLTYSNVTGSSVWLSWSPPLQMNGILRSYTVVYCTEDVKLVCQSSINIMDTHYKLENLINYTKYTVYVLANTTEVSQPSNDVTFKTLVGIPSHPTHLTTFDKNDTILQWTQANIASERVDFYEISIQFLYQGNILEEHIYGVINATSCAITIPPCVNKDHKRLLRVRAITAASRQDEIDPQFIEENNDFNISDRNSVPNSVYFSEDNTLRCFNTDSSEHEQLAQWKKFHDSSKYIFYKSAWQEGITYGCAAPRELAMLFLYVGVFFVFMGCLLLCKTTYEKYKKMSNIQARLPPGLDYTLNDNIGQKNAVMERDNELYLRSKEINNEQKRLLTMDSGYLGESNDVSAIGVSTPPISIGRSSGYDGSVPSIDYYQADYFNAKTKPASPVDDAYTLMQIPKYTSEIPAVHRPISFSSPASTKPTKNKLYAVPEDIVTTSLAGGGTPMSPPHSMSTVNSSGYVETRASQKPTNPASCVSYTTLEAFNRKTPPAPPSGYVTPKELLALGQHSFS